MKPKIPHPLRDPASNLCDIIKFGFFHQLRLLINTGIDLECRDSNKRTPIMLCAFMEPEPWGVGIARILIENNARLDKRDKYGRNAFHYACIYERVGLIQVLLRAMEFDLNQADRFGNTALHYSAMTGNVIVSQVVARAFNKYRIKCDKTNKHGFTAAEEAIRNGNSKCGHVIEQEIMEGWTGNALKDVRFADEASFEEQHQQELPKGQSSAFITSTYNYCGGRVRQLRPWSCSALNRQNSSLSSLSTMEEHASSNSIRSRSNLSFRGMYGTKHTVKPLVAMGIRRDDDVIHCVQADDFRNKPDFIFKLVHLHYDASDWYPSTGQEMIKHNTAWNDTCSGISQSNALLSTTGWRHELKSLFKVYESQCSSSWRAAQRTKSLEEQERLAAEEEEKNKKLRRVSHYNKPGNAHTKEPAPELKRRMSTTRMRRRSSIHGLVGKMPSGTTSSVDGSLNTSTESISSLGMPGKRRGSDNNNSKDLIGSSTTAMLQRSATCYDVIASRK